MAAPAVPQPKTNGQVRPAEAPPAAPEAIAVPRDVVVELLNVALGSVEGQRVWRVWCRTTPAVVALGEIGVRIDPDAAGGLLVVVAVPQ